MATTSQLESLKQALSFDRPPLCSGTISPSSEGLYLYHGMENPKRVRSRCTQGPPSLTPIRRFINFASATPEDLDLLVAACDPATFGRGNEDVHDESYRKAVKMDASNFSVQLDLAGSGLMRIIEDQLLQSETENKYIRAELYKLNVYGDSCRHVSPVSSCLTWSIQTRARSSSHTRTRPVARICSGPS